MICCLSQQLLLTESDVTLLLLTETNHSIFFTCPFVNENASEEKVAFSKAHWCLSVELNHKLPLEQPVIKEIQSIFKHLMLIRFSSSEQL